MKIYEITKNEYVLTEEEAEAIARDLEGMDDISMESQEFIETVLETEEDEEDRRRKNLLEEVIKEDQQIQENDEEDKQVE